MERKRYCSHSSLTRFRDIRRPHWLHLHSRHEHTLFAAAGVLIFGAALLLIRIVMLTFLLMISALAFGAIAIPGLTSYWDKWFNEFLKNILFAHFYLCFCGLR